MMIVKGFKTLCLLIFLVIQIQADITVYDSTTNSTSLSSMLTTMQTNCSSSPVSTLNLCNSTCQTCQATDPSKCSSCSTGYTLSSGACRVDTNLYNYTYRNYVGGNDLTLGITTLASFQFASSSSKLSIDEMCSVCKTSAYEFLTAGLFKATQIISLDFIRVDPIDQIQIKFNFASVVQSMKLYITLNDNKIFSKQFTGFSDLIGIFAKSNLTTTRSFLTLDSLTTTTVSSIWVPIDTGLISYIVTNYTIKFYVQTNSTQPYVWGFNDMVVFTRDCQTCVSQSVKDLITKTGAAVLVTLLIVVVLIIVLFVAIAIEEYRRKVQFQESLGTSATGSDSNLPLKAMARVIESITAIRKARQKEWITEDKKYQLSKKKLQKLESKRPKTMAL